MLHAAIASVAVAFLSSPLGSSGRREEEPAGRWYYVSAYVSTAIRAL